MSVGDWPFLSSTAGVLQLWQDALALWVLAVHLRPDLWWTQIQQGLLLDLPATSFWDCAFALSVSQLHSRLWVDSFLRFHWFQASKFHFSLRFRHVELCSWRDFGSFLEKMTLTLLFCKLPQADQVETARCWDLRLSKSVNIWELWLQGSLHVAWLVWRSWLRVLIVFGSKHVRPDHHFCTVSRL